MNGSNLANLHLWLQEEDYPVRNALKVEALDSCFVCYTGFSGVNSFAAATADRSEPGADIQYASQADTFTLMSDVVYLASDPSYVSPSAYGAWSRKRAAFVEIIARTTMVTM